MSEPAVTAHQLENQHLRLEVARLSDETRRLRALCGVRAFRRTNAWDPSQIAIVARFIANIPQSSSPRANQGDVEATNRRKRDMT